MKYYIIAGEASGDLHASNLIKELKRLDKNAEFRCWGGDLMQNEGAEIVKHYRDLAFMGFTEVIKNIGTIFKNINFCKRDILDYHPDVLILVDYPGFNLRIAEFAHKKGYKVFYYISPQIWAWNQKRVHKISRVSDHVFVILPFEKEFYKKFGYDVDFVGHPLLDAVREKISERSIRSEFNKKHSLDDKPIVALLPGSRKHEIKVMLKKMLAVAPYFPEYQFVIAAAPSISAGFYNEIIKDSEVRVIYNSTYDLLKNSSAALVTSGTATLETALFEVPQVVCYSAGTISYHIARKLIKVKYISLVNLIMDKEVVKELIQDDLTEERLKAELTRLLRDKKYISEMKDNYNDLKIKLGGAGASKKAATLMYGYLQ